MNTNILFTTLRKFYMNTVKPITASSVIISLYSCGYSTAVDNLINNTNLNYTTFVLDIAHSAIIGSCVGIAYPVSIPMMVSINYIMYGRKK
jgi:hypothetical protein